MRRILFAWCWLATTTRALAFGGGLTGGALEITQLANHSELIAQVSEAARQTVTQISQLQTMLQNLRNLDPATLAQIGLSNFPNLQSLADAYPQIETLRSALSDQVHAAERLQQSSSNLERLGRVALAFLTRRNRLDGANNRDWLDPDYVRSVQFDQRMREAQARVRELRRMGIEASAQEVLDAQQYRLHVQQATEAFDNDYRQTLQMANRIPTIRGQVQGLQFLAAQNTQVSKMLTEIAQLIGTQNVEEARRYEFEKQRESHDSRMMELRRQMLRGMMERARQQMRVNPSENSF